MINKHILLITFSEKPKLILLHTVKFLFFIFLRQITIFTIHYFFITVKGFQDCYVTLTFLFNMNRFAHI